MIKSFFRRTHKEQNGANNYELDNNNYHQQRLTAVNLVGGMTILAILTEFYDKTVCTMQQHPSAYGSTSVQLSEYQANSPERLRLFVATGHAPRFTLILLGSRR